VVSKPPVRSPPSPLADAEAGGQTIPNKLPELPEGAWFSFSLVFSGFPSVCPSFSLCFLVVFFRFLLVFPSLGGIQEAIFEEKIFRIFFTQKKEVFLFFLATKYKQDYIWISY
jgi:hypothetical protein